MSKRQKYNFSIVNFVEILSVNEAVSTIKSFKAPAFDSTVEVSINLNVDPRHSDQMIRGSLVLPKGLGKKAIVAVIAEGDKAEEAKNAGADIVGSDDIISEIQSGIINFDRCIATPDMMAKLASVGRILGPRGLMPNPKLGTVTTDVSLAIQNTRLGQVDFKVDKAGVIHAPLGKLSFSAVDIQENVNALIDAVVKLKPSSVKANYIRSCYLSATMVPAVQFKPQNV